jgi:hypothetical protein
VSFTSDYELVEPDCHLIAKAITQGKSSTTTTSFDLAAAISQVQTQGTINGSPTLTVTLTDNQPPWAILDSGFFDHDQDGIIDRVDVNYPDGSRYWWTLTQISPRGADYSIQLTFMAKVAVDMMHLPAKSQPLPKANRATMTRAQFIGSLVNAVGGEYYCTLVDSKQQIEGSAQTASASSKKTSGQAAKTKGLGANAAEITIGGRKATSTQIGVINTIMAVAQQLKAPTKAIEACVYAAIGETNIGQDSDTYHGTGGSTGVWQAQGSHYNGGHDIAGQCRGFFLGGTDFQAGGAIKCANAGHPVWQIANEVEANAVWNHSKQDSYAGHASTADAAAIVNAAGGGGIPTTAANKAATTVTIVDAYYFEVNQGENYWTAVQRLASEVGWMLFLDGDRVYYDSDMALITAQPTAVIDREDVVVTDWSYDWDARAICTQFSLTIICDEFGGDPTSQYWPPMAGEVVQLKRFGTATTASTAVPTKLPGRWLVQDWTRNKGDITTQLTLIQPVPPKLEPAPQTSTSTVASGSKAVPAGAPADKLKAMISMANSLLGAPYSQGNHAASFSQTAAQIKKLGTDCSGFVSLVLKAGGFLTSPQTTETLPGCSGIAKGAGKYVTIYDRTIASGMGVDNEHVIIDLNGQFYQAGGRTSGQGVSKISSTTEDVATFNLKLHPTGL